MKGEDRPPSRVAHASTVPAPSPAHNVAPASAPARLSTLVVRPPTSLRTRVSGGA
jgi:hypothetical protein